MYLYAQPIAKLKLLLACVAFFFSASCDNPRNQEQPEIELEKDRQFQTGTIADPDPDLSRYIQACPGVVWDVKFRFKIFDKVSGDDLFFLKTPKYHSSQIKIDDTLGTKQGLYIIENSTGKYFEINVQPGHVSAQVKYVLTIANLPPINIEVKTIKDTTVVCPIYHVVTAKYNDIEVNNFKGQILKIQL